MPLYFHPPSFLFSFQAEETKVLRLQLELSQNKGELDRRLQEKEEEMDAARYVIYLNLHLFLHKPNWLCTPVLSVAHMVLLFYGLLLGLIHI